MSFCWIKCLAKSLDRTIGFRLETFKKRFCKRAMGLSGRRGRRVSLNGGSRISEEVHSSHKQTWPSSWLCHGTWTLSPSGHLCPHWPAHTRLKLVWISDGTRITCLPHFLFMPKCLTAPVKCQMSVREPVWKTNIFLEYQHLCASF